MEFKYNKVRRKLLNGGETVIKWGKKVHLIPLGWIFYCAIRNLQADHKEM